MPPLLRISRPAAAALCLLAAGLADGADLATCSPRSGAVRATLVELYTSEGCSSCPSADAELSRLSQRPPAAGAGPIVPLALHVPYWDAIGWKDPYAQPVFAERQRHLAAANGQRTVYTPHYFINGREALDWRRELPPALQRTNGQPPGATLGLEVAAASGNTNALTVQVALQSTSSPRKGDDASTLFVALTESGLSSQVTAGENGGVTLHHDHVVRRWLKQPVNLAAPSTQTFQLTLDPRWRRDRLGVTAFVQNPTSGEMLQALALPLCAAVVAQ